MNPSKPLLSKVRLELLIPGGVWVRLVTQTIVCENVIYFSRFKLKGCVRYVFASLFLGLNESTCQIKKNVFLFHFKTSLCSREN